MKTLKCHCGKVEAKIKMRREVHCDGYSIKIPAGHRILCVEDGVKVVRVPVISDEREDGNPHICLKGEAFR